MSVFTACNTLTAVQEKTWVDSKHNFATKNPTFFVDPGGPAYGRNVSGGSDDSAHANRIAQTLRQVIELALQNRGFVLENSSRADYRVRYEYYYDENLNNPGTTHFSLRILLDDGRAGKPVWIGTTWFRTTGSGHTDKTSLTRAVEETLKKVPATAP